MRTVINTPCAVGRRGRKHAVGFVHIGGDVAVRSDDIIGIFDIDNTTVSKHTREFLNSAERGGRVENLAPDIPVSFIVLSGEGRENEKIYFSQYSPRSLGRRAAENPLGV